MRVSDAELRELERRWLESRAVEDESAWLCARTRAGDLAQERLELAALWGNSSARSSQQDERLLSSKELAPLLGVSLKTLSKWVHKGCPSTKRGRSRVFRLCAVLDWYDRERDERYHRPPEEEFMQRASELLVPGSARRASVAGARRILGSLKSPPVALKLATKAVEAVELFLAFPTETSESAAVAACKAPEAWARALPYDERRRDNGWTTPYAVCLAAATSSPALPQYPSRETFNESSSGYALGALSNETEGSPDSAEEAESELRRVMASEVVPWALGYSDPVRTRVTMRGRSELPPEDAE